MEGGERMEEMAVGQQEREVVLPATFYARPALEVARALLGKRLVRVHADGSGRQEARLEARIVETEAYLGTHDLACHASRGRTGRTDVMFGPPGRAYVYFIYGIYHCLNAVTGPKGEAAAVLIRGVEPLAGVEDGIRTDGPGRLCRALRIDLGLNRSALTEGPPAPLSILDAPPLSSRKIARGPRVGVGYAGEWAEKPYRFWIRGSRVA